MTSKDARDWFIMFAISVFGGGVLGYVYLHPSTVDFAMACGTLTTIMGMYHWFTIHDDKVPDVK